MSADNKYFILLQKQITKHTPCVCSELDSSFCEFTIFQSRARKPQCHVGNWVRLYKRKPKLLSFSTNCVLQGCQPVPLCWGTHWHSWAFWLGEHRAATIKIGKELRCLEFIISWPEHSNWLPFPEKPSTSLSTWCCMDFNFLCPELKAWGSSESSRWRKMSQDLTL